MRVSWTDAVLCMTVGRHQLHALHLSLKRGHSTPKSTSGERLTENCDALDKVSATWGPAWGPLRQLVYGPPAWNLVSCASGTTRLLGRHRAHHHPTDLLRDGLGAPSLPSSLVLPARASSTRPGRAAAEGPHRTPALPSSNPTVHEAGKSHSFSFLKCTNNTWMHLKLYRSTQEKTRDLFPLLVLCSP